MTSDMPSSFLVLGALLAVVVSLIFRRFNKRISPSIPYAGSPTSSRDATLLERLQVPQEYAKDPVSFLCKTRSILGDVFCVDLLAVKMVFVLGPESNRVLLKAPEKQLSFDEAVKWSMGRTVAHRESIPLFSPLDGVDRCAVFKWPGFMETTNPILKQALLRQEHLDAFYDMCRRVTESHFEEWSQQDSIPLFQSISHLIISNLLVLLAGEDNYARHGAELVPMMAQFERDVQKPILRVLPWSLWGFTEPGKSLAHTGARFNTLMVADMNDIVSHPEKHEGREDYFYMLVSAAGKRFEACYGGHIMSLIFGGHANAAMSIPWLFLHARRTPGALDKICEEATLGRGERKPFLEACLRETGRLYTNTNVLRKVMEETRVGGHVIPAGTLVAASPTTTQRVDLEDGGIYENAGHWDPARFLASAKGDGQAQLDASAYSRWFQKAEFVQFGLGPHACPGEKLARMLIFDLVLKTWMEKYDVQVVSGLREGELGLDGVGVEAAWVEENFGTPSVRGKDVMVSVRKRS